MRLDSANRSFVTLMVLALLGMHVLYDAERNVRMARHSTCLPMGAKQLAEAERSAPDTDAENEVAERV